MSSLAGTHPQHSTRQPPYTCPSPTLHSLFLLPPTLFLLFFSLPSLPPSPLSLLPSSCSLPPSLLSPSVNRNVLMRIRPSTVAGMQRDNSPVSSVPSSNGRRPFVVSQNVGGAGGGSMTRPGESDNAVRVCRDGVIEGHYSLVCCDD